MMGNHWFWKLWSFDKFIKVFIRDRQNIYFRIVSTITKVFFFKIMDSRKLGRQIFFRRSPKNFNYRKHMTDIDIIIFQSKFQIECSFKITWSFHSCICLIPLRPPQKLPYFDSFFFEKLETFLLFWFNNKQNTNNFLQLLQGGANYIFLFEIPQRRWQNADFLNIHKI